VNAIPGLRIISNPDATIFAIASDEIDVFKLADFMGARGMAAPLPPNPRQPNGTLICAHAMAGWSLEREHKPNALHFTVTARHKQAVDQLLRDLAAGTEAVRAHPEQFEEGMAPMYGMAAKVPDRELVGDLLLDFMDFIET